MQLDRNDADGNSEIPKKFTVRVDVNDWLIAEDLAEVILDFLRPLVPPDAPLKDRPVVICGPKEE